MGFHADKIAILGTGLIGGSILKACVERNLANKIAVYDANPAVRNEIAQAKLANVFITNSAREAAQDANIVFLCGTPNRIEESVAEIVPVVSPKTIVTDVCSVKDSASFRRIDRLLAGKAHWIGAHPMAGREAHGFAAASADLFQGRKTVMSGSADLFQGIKTHLTPTIHTYESAAKDISDFWQLLGAEVVRMSPEQHDRLVAQISHMPHLIAYLLARSASPESLEIAGPGFRDITRIAGSSPELWQEILLSNREKVLATLTHFEQSLREAREALEKSDSIALLALLKEGNEMRRKLDAPPA